MTKGSGLTRAKAIVNFCAECQGNDSFRGGKVGESRASALAAAKACGDVGCPLHAFRPGMKLATKSKGNPDALKQARVAKKNYSQNTSKIVPNRAGA